MRFFIVVLLGMSFSVYGVEKHPLSEYVDELIADIHTTTGMTTKKSIPDVIVSESISPDVRASKCGFLCKEYAPNVYLSRDNVIWLRKHSRTDQLLHELVHYFQSCENDDDITGSSPELEIEAIRVQSLYYRNGDDTY